MSKKIRIGIDWDGTLTKYPLPLAWYFSIRPGGEPHFFLRFIEIVLPTILDGPLIDSIPCDWDVYVISARVNCKKARELLEKTRFWKQLYFKPSFIEKESDYKTRIAKKLKLDYFFDDRRKTIKALRKNGIEAIDIKEIRKCLKRRPS